MRPLDRFVGVEGYHAGDDGHLYSSKHSDTPKQLARNKMQGYYYSKVNGKMVRAHRLIAWAFCKGYKKGLVVNHIDSNPLNNKPSNLEWVTQKQNINHKKPDNRNDERGDMMAQKETRFIEDIEIRANKEEDTISLSGYVVKFDTRSHFLGFYETVDKRAFDRTIKEDNNVYALFNHDWDKPLASTRNGTLELSTDDVGLRFKLTPKANTSYMRDIVELVNSGELRGCSFGFKASDDDWTTKDGYDYRTLKDVDLLEVTLTPVPAYESSQVSVRSYDKYKEEQRKQELELLKLQLDLIKLKIQ